MTAISQYQRLETTGVWHAHAKAQRRDVGVVLGEATLVLKDAADNAVTHWSLAAVTRVGNGSNPAVFAPGAHAEERLELTDPEMIDALDRVRRAIDRAQPRQWRVRFWLTVTLIVIVATLSVTWLPGAMVTHTASALPEATRQDIGRRLVRALEPHMGRSCRSADGQAALAQLSRWLLGTAPWDLQVLEAGTQALALPGGIIVIGGELLASYDDPDVIAGHVLLAAEQATQASPTFAALEAAGTSASFALLTTGQISDATLGDIAQSFVLNVPGADLDADQIVARFTAAQLSPGPFAATLPDQSALKPVLVAASSPIEPGSAPGLSDRYWVALQSMCDKP